jgi:hypothetical protein
VPTESGTVVVAAAAAAAAAICANLLHAGYNILLTKTAISAWGKDRKEPLKTTKATEEGIDRKEQLKTTKATEEGIDRKEQLKTTKATELLCHACPLPAHTQQIHHTTRRGCCCCHLIENKAFRHYFAYLFDLFLFFFKTDANCFRSERQRCNAIVDAINHG